MRRVGLRFYPYTVGRVGSGPIDSARLGQTIILRCVSVILIKIQ